MEFSKTQYDNIFHLQMLDIFSKVPIKCNVLLGSKTNVLEFSAGGGGVQVTNPFG